MEGKIKFYNFKKGYGFIILENNEIIEDVFFRKEDVFDDPVFFKPVDRVVFNIIEKNVGKHAINIMCSSIDYLKESKRF